VDQTPREKLCSELLVLDCWGDFSPQTYQARWTPKHNPDSLDVLSNVGVPADHFPTYLPVLLNALDEPTPDTVGSIVWILCIQGKKGMQGATWKLIKLFFNEEFEENKHLLRDAARAINKIAPRDYLEECISICLEPRFGDARSDLIRHLSRFKKSEKAFQALLLLLEETPPFVFVRGAALEALKRLGDVRAIPAIERTRVRSGSDGIYESHQKMMALKKLYEKLGKHDS